MSTQNSCAIWISLHDGQCSKQAMDVDDKHMQKCQKRSESRIEDTWGRKAVLTGKGNM